jgi:hypothetical protein
MKEKTEGFECPELKNYSTGKGNFNKVKSHPNENELKECLKDNSL